MCKNKKMLINKKFIHFIILNGFLNLKSCFYSEACKPKVAIIGAGIGGASASYFLTKLFKNNLEIDIFESKEIGGRLATVKFGNEKFETGGAIIHPRNKYMKEFVKLLNLQPKSPLPGSTFGIWNGKEFVFKESNWKVFTLLKLIYRYGLEPIYLHRYITTILDDFEKIYDLQDQGIAFENVTALLNVMNRNFINLLQTSIKHHLTELGYGQKLIDELVEATIVVNYGQDTNVHSFVASVSVAGAGFDLWSVKGGNKEVPKKLIYNNKQISVIYSTVKKINRQIVEAIPKYEIFYVKNDSVNIMSKVYDIIIIAAPMTNDQETSISFNGFQSTDLIFPGEYQTTYATFVSGAVNSSYFGFEEEFGGIMSCDPVETKISSIGRLSSVEGTKDNTSVVWKIFSRQKLENSLLLQMFSRVDKVEEIRWKAYPHYESTMRVDKFKLDDLMYHVNAIEWAASAMEMSAISGRNAAILAFNDYQQQCLFNKFIKEEHPTHSYEL